MGIVATTTAGGNQQGNVGDGQYNGDFSEGKSQNAATQGGTQAGVQDFQNDQTVNASGANSSVTINQDDPGAIAALNNVLQASLQAIGSTASQAMAYEQSTAQSAIDDAYLNTGRALGIAKDALTPGDQRTYVFAGIALGLAALVAVAFFWSKKNA